MAEVWLKGKFVNVYEMHLVVSPDIKELEKALKTYVETLIYELGNYGHEIKPHGNSYSVDGINIEIGRTTGRRRRWYGRGDHSITIGVSGDIYGKLNIRAINRVYEGKDCSVINIAKSISNSLLDIEKDKPTYKDSSIEETRMNWFLNKAKAPMSEIKHTVCLAYGTTEKRFNLTIDKLNVNKLAEIAKILGTNKDKILACGD